MPANQREVLARLQPTSAAADEVMTQAAVEPPAVDRPDPVIETNVADIRDTAEPDSTERADPAQRHRVPTADETAAAVARAQAALAEIEARRAADAEREARDAEHPQRREELTRWAEQDRTAEPPTVHDHQADDDTMVLQR